MLLQINNPKPVPLHDFEANFSNNLGNTSESILVPLSLTVTATNFSRLLFCLFSSIPIDTIPGGSQVFLPLLWPLNLSQKRLPMYVVKIEFKRTHLPESCFLIILSVV